MNRLTGGDRDVWNGFGKYSDEDGERLREAVREGREEMEGDVHDRGERVAAALEETDGDD